MPCLCDDRSDRDCLCRLDVTRVSRPQAITELLEKTVRRLQPLVSANAGHSGDDPLSTINVHL